MTQLTIGQKEEIRSIFQHLASNQDDLIDHKDMATVLRCLGQNPTHLELKEIERRCLEVGTLLDFDSVIMLVEEIGLKSQKEEEDELRLAFRAIDRDGNGFITEKELKHYLKLVGEQMSEAEVEELIAFSDKNKDGVIDYEEFVEVMADHIM